MEPLVSLVAFPMIEWIVIGFSEPMDSATEVNTAIFCLCKKKQTRWKQKFKLFSMHYNLRQNSLSLFLGRA